VKTIFICIDWFSPAYKGGGPIVSISNLVSTFKEGVLYKIICSNYDLGDEPLQGIAYDTWVKYNDNTLVWYASKNIKLIALLKAEIKKTPNCLIYINGIYSFYYNLLPILLISAKKIISPRGMLHPEAISKKKNKKLLYLKILKLLRVGQNSDFHATTAEEAEYLKNNFGKNINIVTAGNFPKNILPQPRLQKKIGYLKLVSISLVSPMKNHLNVLFALENATEQIEYAIYGPIKDQAYWRLCLKIMKELPSNISVEYHSGIVADEVEKVLMQSHVFIQPSESENFGHSIFEALSAGKPVITSTRTPWNNLQEANAGINVSAKDIKGLTDSIHYFSMMDNAEYEKWATGARQYSENAIDIGMLKRKYKELFSV